MTTQKSDLRGVIIRPQNRGGVWLWSPNEPNPRNYPMMRGYNPKLQAIGEMLYKAGYNKKNILSHADSPMET